MLGRFFYRWILNPMMKVILRSPLHRLVSGSMMLISFSGRKTGRRYTTPVGYARDGEGVICLTHADWWKNLRDGAPVTVRIQGHDYEGRAEAVREDKERVAAGIRQFLLQVPSWAGFYNVTMNADGTPDAEAVARAAQEAILIEIRLQQG